MKINIHAGQRVLYKLNGQWNAGNLVESDAKVRDNGLFLFVVSDEEQKYVEINDIFLDAEPVEDWMREYGYLMTKEDYINHIQSEEFDKNNEIGYVSDGEYYYYPVGAYNKNWLMKQPFDYIVRNDNGV